MILLTSEHLSFKWASLLHWTVTTYKISTYLSLKAHFLYLVTASEEIQLTYDMIIFGPTLKTRDEIYNERNSK
jgi:hypothetical protein